MPWAGHVLDQRREIDDTGLYTVHLGLGVAERSDRPVTPILHERRVDDPGLVAREECEFQPDVAVLVTGLAILSRLGGVHPSLLLQQHPDAIEVCLPHGDINVRVIPRHSADVEINRPAAEEPVVMPCSAKSVCSQPIVCSCVAALLAVVMVSGPLAGWHPIVSRERASLGGGDPSSMGGRMPVTFSG
jgi:hypothetical protein